MERTELVSVMNDGAALFYAMALTAFRPRYRARLFANARMQRFKAALAWCGVPVHMLRMLSGPAMCDKGLREELLLPLARYKAGQLTEPQIKRILMAYFDMPMPQDDYEYLVEYVSKMLTSLIEEETTVKVCAHDIGSVIEAERDNHALRSAKHTQLDGIV